MSLAVSTAQNPDFAHAPSKRERRKEARPGELIAAAMDLFVEKGFAATRAEEVAARAGVSKGTLFLYFQSKEDLFKAVVNENIAGNFPEWNAEFDVFDGTSAQMLQYAMTQWWQRLGATKASGISKLIMAEARNFPEIAAYYQQTVMVPGQALIRRIFQRGIDSGEFCPVNLDYAIYSVIAPMQFLIMWKHSMAPCLTQSMALVPEDYIRVQAELITNGLLRRDATPPTKGKHTV